MPLILPGNVGSATAATGYNVANSCMFNDGDSAYMHRTPSAGNRRTMTLSVWIKGSSLADGSNNVLGQYNSSNANNAMLLVIEGSGKIMIWNYTDTYTMDIRSNRLLRDNSSWYHIVVAVDTTQSTASNRVKVYVNGVQETSLHNGSNAAATYPSENLELFLNQGVAQNIGTQRYGSTVGSPFDGYMAEFCFIDGTQNAVTDFGEFDEDSGIWKPIDVSGLTFGTNGYYLDFEDSSALGNDVSGNDNDFTTVNLAAIDQSTDTCTNNFATFNPLTTIDASLIKEGNLFPELATADESVVSTIAMTSGKWYWEAKVTDQGSRGYHGITSYTVPQIGGNAPRISGFSFAVAFGHDGTTGAGVGTVNSNFKGSAIANDEILTFCFDADNGQIWIDINAVDISGTATVTGLTTGIPYFAFFEESGSNADRTDVKYNFGSPPYTISSGNTDGDGYGNFEYAVPSGYYSLCTKNLAEYG